MEININPKTNNPALLLSNADNESVFVEDLSTFKELVGICGGAEETEIYFPKAGWMYLSEALPQKSEEDDTEDDLIEYFFEKFQSASHKLA